MEIREDWGLQSLVEVKDRKPKKGVLMTLEGESFFRDLPSRNKRRYPGKAWPNALKQEETKHMLENGLMFGTIGHLDVDMDELVRDNKVAIRTVNLTFNEKTGIGRGVYEVLDTPLGRTVQLLHESGSNFFVSTKAAGSYKDKDEDGNELVDENNLFLRRVDLVCNPGFLQAQPKLAETLEEAYHELEEVETIAISSDADSDIYFNIIKKGTGMKDKNSNEELISKVIAEKIQAENEVLSLSEDLKRAESDLQNLKGLKEKCELYENEILKLRSTNEKVEKFFEEVGDMDLIEKTLRKAGAFGSEIAALGGLDQIRNCLSQLEEFLELADDASSVEEALTRSLNLQEQLSDLVDIEAGEDVVGKIKEALEGACEYLQNQTESRLKNDVAEVAAKFGINDADVEELVRVNGVQKASRILNSLKGSKSKNFTENKTINDILHVDDSRASRLFSSKQV